MDGQETIKVYELAKELGIDSISLLDKLNGLDIKVKNHMSELAPGDAERARTSLLAKVVSPPAKKAKAPAVRKKKTSAPVSEANGPSTDAGAETRPVTRTARSAKAVTPEVATEKKAASPIIRRRSKDGALISDSSVSSASQRATDEARADGIDTETFSADEAIGAGPEAATALVDDATEAQSAIVEGSALTSAASVPETTTTPAVPARKFLNIVDPSTTQVKSALRTVTPAPATKTGGAASTRFKGTTTQDKDGFRIIKMTKENLDQMVEEEAAKKRGGGREQDIRPEDVNFGDYRKKEMVFLPRRKKLPVGKSLKQTEITTPKAEKRIVEMGETITVQELANQLKVKTGDVLKKLMMMGQMVTINQPIDIDTATLLAGEYQYEVKNISFDEETLIGRGQDTEAELQPRPPVVTVMGHVDHGKTSLLDAIRQANVAAGEAGGITQHIGAYTVEQNGKLITFIDTPGHEAFTTMRARGANVTDIVILVVAADDGVMPQTREALAHAKAAGVPIVVAVNKMDKPGANPDKVKQALAELDLLAEDWGGQTMFVPVSAIKKTNIDKLLEAVLLQSEVMELKANAKVRASGTVLEARLDRGRGPVASVLVKRGTLRVGDAIVAGSLKGRIKAMVDYQGRMIKEVTPGMAAEVLGFEAVPNGGDAFDVMKSETDAEVLTTHRTMAQKAKAQVTQTRVSLDDLFSKIQQGAVKELNIILKADAFGSVEAIRDSLQKLSNDQVKVKVIHTGIGGVTESDVLLAAASKAVILGFNVRPETKARQLAESEHIEVKSYSIIYELIDDVKNSMVGLLDKKKIEKFLGRAEVRQTFSVPKLGTIAGCFVVDGKIIRNANARLLRDSRVIFEGKLGSLRRFKDDAREVAQGFECGMGFENYNDIKVGDLIEVYEVELVTPELNAPTANA